jgi:hypothetical protein
MDNTDFKHFFWGVQNHPESKLYGLSNLSYNKFYLISDDYQLLKTTQMTTMVYYPTVLVNLTAFHNYTNGIIDNLVCFNWGINDRAVFQPALTGFLSTYQKKFYDQLHEYSYPTTDFDVELQKKLFLIYKILSDTQLLIERQCNNYIDYKHNQSLKEYFSIILPEDQDIQKMIDKDQTDLEQFEKNIRHSWNTVVKILADTDYEQSYHSLENSIIDQINNCKSFNDFRYKHTIKNHLLNTI